MAAAEREKRQCNNARDVKTRMMTLKGERGGLTCLRHRIHECLEQNAMSNVISSNTPAMYLRLLCRVAYPPMHLVNHCNNVTHDDDVVVVVSDACQIC